MEVTHNRVRVAPFLEEQAVPVDVLDRKAASEVWLVSMEPLGTGSPLVLTAVKTGDHVTVPIVPYQVRQNPSLAFGFLMSIGLKAGTELARSEWGRKYEIERLHLALGDTVDQLDGGVVRFYGGFAAKLRSR